MVQTRWNIAQSIREAVAVLDDAQKLEEGFRARNTRV
jgi:hypothetical protein